MIFQYNTQAHMDIKNLKLYKFFGSKPYFDIDLGY